MDLVSEEPDLILPMMTYLALLRGINVGGKTKVAMTELKQVFERLGFEGVQTYINSGNVIFVSDEQSLSKLTGRIEAAIERHFGFPVKVIVRSAKEIEKLVNSLPDQWVNDQTMKCDVMFLAPEIDNKAILKSIPFNPAIEDVVYYPGAVVWRIDRDKVRPGQVLKIIGSNMYKQMTVRNPNTVRALHKLMQPFKD